MAERDADGRLIDEAAVIADAVEVAARKLGVSQGAVLHMVVMTWIDRLADRGRFSRESPLVDTITNAIADVSRESGSADKPKKGDRRPMRGPIHLAPDLHLPLDIVTESVAILARKRAGKSVTAKRLYEQLHGAGLQVGGIDPKGDWWGVRSSADGKHPGLPVLIIGGEHGDVPLEPGSGELVASLVVRERVSFVLDLSELRKHQVATFMTAFLETLYRMKAKDEHRTPMMLVVDEADAIAPQRPQHGEERMLGAAEDIVRRGGQRGIGITLVSQRAAVLNKNVLTQCGILFLLQTTGSQDIDAVDDWIKKHGQAEKRAQVMADIGSLPKGTAWVWAPGWPAEHGIFKRVEISLNETFDSGATPKPGEKRAVPKTVADVDLDAFRTAMAETIEKAKADDPRELRKRIAQLEQELKVKRAAMVTVTAKVPKEKRVEVPVVDAKTRKALVDGGNHVRRAEQLLEQVAGSWNAIAEKLKAVDVAAAAPPAAAPLPHFSALAPRHAPPPRPRPTPAAPVEGVPQLDAPQRKVLSAIAQEADAGVDRAQLSVLTGYARSTRDRILGELRRAGCTADGGRGIVITDAGVAALGDDYQPLPTGIALLEHWLRTLDEGGRRVLEFAARSWPHWSSREEISEATKYARSTRDRLIGELARRKLLQTGRDGVRASDLLFDGERWR